MSHPDQGKRQDKQKKEEHESAGQKNKEEKRDERNSYHILKNADPDCKDQKLDIFFKKINEIIGKLGI
jgi:hypothetical protein